METCYSKWATCSQSIYSAGYIYGSGTVICFNLLASKKFMLEDYQEQQRKRTTRLRSFMDFTMGGLFIAIGIVLLVYQVTTLADLNRKGLGVLFILYGIW